MSTRLEVLRGHETRWCRQANHWCRRRSMRRFFALISRLGDGVFWYALMTLLVVCDGMDGVFASAHMAATGVVALSLYKGLKRWTRRPRPYAADLRIRAWVAKAPNLGDRVSRMKSAALMFGSCFVPRTTRVGMGAISPSASGRGLRIVRG